MQGRPLLAAKSAPSDAQGYVHVPLVGGTAQLPELSVTGEQGDSNPVCAAYFKRCRAPPLPSELCCSPPLLPAGPALALHGDTSSNLRTPSPHVHSGPAGSSEALLSGQRPPFALLVRPMQAGEGAGAGERAAGILPLVSEAFVVS